MRLRLCLILVFICALMPFAPAEAKRAHHVVAEPQLIPALPPLYTTYDVYVGGIHLVQAQIWFEEQGSRYHAVVRANTFGFWGRLFPWDTVLDAYGRIKGDHFEPVAFYTRDEWDKKPKITELHFDGKGNVTPRFDPPNTDQNREIVTTEQSRHSLDPVTALLQMLAHVAVDGSCAIPVPVFDGKRRFDITGRDAGFEETDSEDYGVYSGKARLCAADFKMISGEWKDGEHARFWKKTETEPGREPFRIWLASVDKGLPEIPVRMESGSIAGLVVVHLSAWHYVSVDEIKAQTPQH
ncbi:MAG: DUF3108 domain-containing protein [Alphaproteobacteria bacterium]|nr:DUF3108 domain-containing protein [Alphaproteobacteria bacterium]